MKPLLVLDHIPKNAGSALRQVAVANVGQPNLIDLDRKVMPLLDRRAAAEGVAALEWSSQLELYRPMFKEMSSAEGAVDRCFVGHTAPFFIAAIRPRPVRVLCMLRDPVDRVISTYFYLKRRNLTLPGGHAHLPEMLKKLGWRLGDIYRELAGAGEPRTDLEKYFAPLFNGQTRHILGSVRDPLPIPLTEASGALDAFGEEALRILDETRIVGTQDRFSESIRLFAASLGWRRPFVPSANTTPRPLERSTVDEDTRALIRANNRLDAELHAQFSRRLAELPAVSYISDLHGRAYHRTARRLRRLRRRLSA